MKNNALNNFQKITIDGFKTKVMGVWENIQIQLRCISIHQYISNMKW